MVYLIAGLALFSVVHLYSLLMPVSRDGLKARLGEGRYKGLYSLVSLAGVALIVWGYHAVSNGPEAGDIVYQPGAGNRHITIMLVLLAFILLGAANGKGYIRLWVQNPMSLGIALWATGHLLSNGRAYDLYLFGTFLVIAVLDIVLSTARGQRPVHVPQVKSDIRAIVAGVILFAIFAWGFHPYILGIPVIG